MILDQPLTLLSYAYRNADMLQTYMTGSSRPWVTLVMVTDIWRDLQDQEQKEGLFKVLQDEGSYLV